MSIASEFESTIENVQNAYQGLANLGATIPQNKTIENISDCLDGVYDVLPKTEYQEGTEITLSNTLKGKLDYENGVVGIGQSSQETTTGKNKLNYNDLKQSAINVGFVVDSEGNIKDTSPSADGRSWNYAGRNWQVTLPAGTYTLTYYFSVQATAQNAGGVVFDSSDSILANFGSTLINTDRGSRTFTLASETSIGIMVKLFDGVCKVQLESGSTSTDWEKFTFGASPNPNYEQQIKGVEGRNKADPSKLNLGKTLGNTGALIDLDNRTTSFQNQVEPNTSYALSVNSGYQIGNLFYYDKNKTYSSSLESAWSNSKVITIPNNAYCVSFATRRTDNTTMTESDLTSLHLQIEQGSTSTPYLPYNTIEEVVSGINKLDISALSNQSALGITATIESNKTITLTGTSTGSGSLYGVTNLNLKLGPGTYKWVGKLISGNGTIPHSGADIAIYIRKSNEILAGVVLSDILSSAEDVNTFSLQEETELYFSIFVNTANIVLNANIGLMILKDTITDLTYEPYITPTSYQLSLGDYKFYGIGTYRDYILRTTGKNLFNIADCRNNYTLGSDGIPTYNSAQTRIANLTPIIVEGMEKVTMTFTNYHNGAFMYSLLRADNTLITRTINCYSGTTITIGEAKYMYICFYDNATTENVKDAMLVKGSTASDYQPFGVGNWYKVGKVGNVVVDGTNKGVDGRWGTNVADEYRFLIDVNDNINAPSSSEKIGILCNIFKETTANQSYMNVQGICALASNHTLAIYSDEIKTKTIDEVNTWLHTNILEAYYPLVSPTYTPITGTLAEQLEAWWNGQTLNGTTIITSNGNLPMIIKVRGLKGE